MGRLAAFAVLIASSTGCATMIAAKTEPYRVESTPPGQPVLLNGKPVGVTPVSIDVERQRPAPIVQVGDPAGVHGSCKPAFHAGGAYVAADLAWCVTTVVGCIAFMDASSGAWNQLDRDSCRVDLEYEAKISARDAEKERQRSQREQSAEQGCLQDDATRTFDTAMSCAQLLQSRGKPEGSSRLWGEALKKARTRDETCIVVNAVSTISVHPEADLAGASPMVVQGCIQQKACLKRCADDVNTCLNTPVQQGILDEHTAGCYDNERACKVGCQ